MSSAVVKPSGKSALKVVNDTHEAEAPADAGEAAPASAVPPLPAEAESAVEQALQQLALEQRPLIRRSDSARSKVAQRVREVESEMNDLDAREAVLDRLYEAAKRGFADQRGDLADELDLYQNGLNTPGHSGSGT